MLKHNLIKLRIPNRDPAQPNSLEEFDPNTQLAVLQWFIEELTAKQVEHWLLERSIERNIELSLPVPARNSRLSGNRRDAPSIPSAVVSEGENEDASHKQVRDKRNAITHGFIQVTDSDVGNAIALVEKNINNYRNKWARWQNESLDVTEFQPASLEMPEKAKCYAAPDWKILLTACGLEAVLRPKVR